MKFTEEMAEPEWYDLSVKWGKSSRLHHLFPPSKKKSDVTTLCLRFDYRRFMHKNTLWSSWFGLKQQGTHYWIRSPECGPLHMNPCSCVMYLGFMNMSVNHSCKRSWTVKPLFLHWCVLPSAVDSTLPHTTRLKLNHTHTADTGHCELLVHVNTLEWKKTTSHRHHS